MIVKNNTLSMHNIFDTVQLMPGPNMVPDDVWSAVKDKGMVKVRLDLGEYEEIEAATPAALIKTIKQSANLTDLREWSSDSRSGVAKAADARLKEILSPKGPK